MDSNSIDLAYHALGGAYLYAQALSKGIGLPNLMLNANDAFLHGSASDLVTVLVDQLVERQWETFQNPCFEPNEAFEKCYIKLLCKRDEGWKQFKNKIRKSTGFGLRSLMSTNPKGFDNLPGQAHNELAKIGWEYMTQSQRVVFRKEISCLKIALDVDGLEQNYNEYYFLSAKGPGMYRLKISPRKHIDVGVPEVYSHHPRYLWITRQWVDGDIPEMKPKDFEGIREAIMTMFPLKDIRPANLLWDYKNGCYWIVDPGIPLRKTY